MAQAMMKFEKRRHRDTESILKLQDNLELLRRSSNPKAKNFRIEFGHCIENQGRCTE